MLPISFKPLDCDSDLKVNKNLLPLRLPNLWRNSEKENRKKESGAAFQSIPCSAIWRPADVFRTVDL